MTACGDDCNGFGFDRHAWRGDVMSTLLSEGDVA